MIEIAPGPDPPDAEIEVPGSKYEANRLLLAAALAEGESRIRGAPQNEDIEAAITALSAIGAGIRGAPGALRVRGLGRGAARPASGPLEVSVGESGTLLRFLTAAAATVPIPVRITGGGRIHERPISGLVAALRALGAEIETTGSQAPLVIRSGALEGGRVRVSARESSQFASALLLAAPRARGTVVIELADEPVSRSYLDLTVSVMARCGVRVEAAGDRRFRIGAGERYPGGDHRVSGDWTTAGYFFAAAAAAPGRVRVSGLDPRSPQGERRFPALLGEMGCEVNEDESDGLVRVSVRGPRRLRGIAADMGSMPDAAPTLAAIAPFAVGPTRLTGIAHLRHKESDRLAAMAEGLSGLGARAEAHPDALTIQPSALRPGTVHPRGDHRIAMALSLIGLRVPGVQIETPGVVGKSFPGFWTALAGLGARVSGSGRAP